MPNSLSKQNSTPGAWVFLDGEILPREAAKISVNDRGFLFAHAAYEVTAVFNGNLIDFEHHMARLERTLAGIEVDMPSIDFADRSGS